jgi:protocatechuate 3,4-dioxygenase beta subunit
MLIVTVGNPVPTQISVNVTNSNPAVNQSFTLSGYLKDLNGTPLPDRTIGINIELPDGLWDMSHNTTTDSKGYFSVTLSEQSQGFYHFECAFLGDTIYGETSSIVDITVGTLTSTTLTMNPSVANPVVGQSFTLSGSLTDVNGTPLAGKEIHLDVWVNGQPATPGGIYAWAYTDQNGHYSFTITENASGSYQYMAVFAGDQNYAESYMWMQMTLG